MLSAGPRRMFALVFSYIPVSDRQWKDFVAIDGNQIRKHPINNKSHLKMTLF